MEFVLQTFLTTLIRGDTLKVVNLPIFSELWPYSFLSFMYLANIKISIFDYLNLMFRRNKMDSKMN